MFFEVVMVELEGGRHGRLIGVWRAWWVLVVSHMSEIENSTQQFQ